MPSVAVLQELGVNVSALQAAAWSTLGRQPPAAGQRTAPGAAEAEVAGVVEEVAALWAAAPSKARKAKEAGEAEAAAARKQVEYVLGSMAAALDDMAFLLQQGEAAEGADKVAAVPEVRQGVPCCPLPCSPGAASLHPGWGTICWMWSVSTSSDRCIVLLSPVRVHSWAMVKLAIALLCEC